MSETATRPVTSLHDLLDDAGRRFAPDFEGGLANHLPMLLHALDALGASPARLRAYADGYATRLEPADAGPLPSLPSDWRGALGQRAMFRPLRAHFEAAIARDGMRSTLAGALPALMPGVGASAFHGLLRTAHGVAAGHRAEMASGLAYWAATHLPLAPTDAGQAGTRSLPEWAAALLALPAPAGARAPNIQRRMSAWADVPGFGEAAHALAIDAAQPGDTLDAIARLAAGVYAVTRNFTVLHVVTSTQALRLLAPWQHDPAGAVRHHTVAVAAGLCAARLAPGDLSDGAASAGASASSSASWSEVIRAAIASDDDHVAKLVHACRSLHADLGDAVFLRAAARAVEGDLRGAAR